MIQVLAIIASLCSLHGHSDSKTTMFYQAKCHSYYAECIRTLTTPIDPADKLLVCMEMLSK